MSESRGSEAIYFAYGSNMSHAQMQKRCPNSVPIGTACLRDWRLTFPRYSKKRKCAVASIEEFVGAEVWGVLWKLAEQDRTNLDTSEGYRAERPKDKNSYNPIDINATCFAGTSIPCFTYKAVRQDGYSGKPNRDYLERILEGARKHSLPGPYLSGLEHIECQD